MKINNEIRKVLLLLIGGIGITLSGINWNIGIAAWIAPVFLLLYSRNAKWFQMVFFFLVVAISGTLSQTSSNLHHLASVNITNGLFFGVTYSIAYVLDKLIYRKEDRFYYTLLFPSAIVLVEFSVSSLIGTWGTIPHTQYQLKSILQLSSITGIFGITFIVAWFSSVVNWAFEKKNDWQVVSKSILIYGSILCFVLLYGDLRNRFQIPAGDSVKVAAVISETDIHKIVENEKDALEELSKSYNAKIPSRVFSDSHAIETLLMRTCDASKQGAQIIVWNEIALVLNQDQKKDLVTEVKSICLKDNVYVLLAFLEECLELNKKPFNNKSILISPTGEVEWEYMKSFVHPIAEAPLINSGNCEIPVVQTEYGKIGNVICYDLDMNSYLRQAGKQSVDILLVPAFDWEEITPLHSQMACLEAVQYGFSIVRSNGKGLAAIYDYMGNTIASLNTLTSNTKIVYADVPIQSPKTFYSASGDLIFYLAVLFLIFLITKNILKRRKSQLLKIS